jgi:hypothetical protein
MKCDFPYTGTNCSITFAESIGKNYSFYHGFFLASALLSFTLTTIQNIRSHIYTSKSKYIMQKQILALSWLMSLLFLIQAIDPEGYGGILPPIIEILASSFTTYIGLVIVFTVIYHLIQIINQDVRDLEKGFWQILALLTAMMIIIISFLQVEVDRSVARGCKLIIFSLITTLATYKVDRVFYTLLNKLREPRSLNTERMRWFIGIFNVFIVTVIIYQLVSGILTIVNRSQETATLDSDQIFFPFAELLGILISTSFMSKMKYDDELQILMPSNL